MECPRCPGELDRYALAGGEAVVCDGCGYVGVPVEHRGEPREIESWDEAIRRFRESGSPATERTRGDDGIASTPFADLEPAVVPVDSDGEDTEDAATDDAGAG